MRQYLITELDIAHQRLFNQHLAGNSFEKPEEVVNWLGAVQAQDYAGAKWALGLRLQDAMDSDIDRAFNDGAILRTHLMRPTWHFVTPTDIRWLLALTAPRVHALNATYYRKAGLDRELFKRSNAALVKALQGGVQLTRDELRVVLQGAGVPTEGELRMSYLMMQAELEGIVCSGARRGKQFTYALLDERAPHAKILEREQALAELAGRYFTSRGPSTVQDFAKWSGLTIADARSGLEAAKRQLREEVVDGRSYWLPASSPTVEVVAPTALLLSIYDEYISGYKDRSAIIDEELGVRLIAMGNALYYVIVVDGRILGTWNRTLKKEAVIIEMRLFTELTETENLALAAAARRYGQFLGLPVVLA
jgi:hypothetical protein